MPKACILSGGGSKGAFEVGVLRQLQGAGVSFDAVYGTSVGSLNAVGYSFMDASRLYDLWNVHINKTSDVFGNKFLPVAIFEMLFCKGKGFYNMDPLNTIVTTIVRNNEPRIPATVCFVNLTLQTPLYATASPIQKADSIFIKSVVASAATPVLNDLIDGTYCDGGLRHITPVNKAIQDGATELCLILCEPYESSDPSTPPGNFIDTGLKAIGALVQEIFWRDAQDAINSGLPVTIYAPLTNLPSATDFSHKTIAASLQLGLTAQPVKVANKK